MTKWKCEELLDAFLGELRVKRKSNKLYFTTNPMPPNGEFWQMKARAAEKIAQQQRQSQVEIIPFKPLLSHEIDFLRYEAMSNEAHNRAMYRNCVMGDWDMKEYTVCVKVEDDAPTLTPEMIINCIDEFRNHPPKEKILEVCPGPDEYVKYTSSLFGGTFVSLSGKLFKGGELIGNVYEKK